MKRMWAVLIVLILAVLAIAGGLLFTSHRRSVETPALINPATLAALPIRNASGTDFRHLEAGLVPPTNKWFTGVALQQTPQAIFPTPLRFSTTETSFTFSLPEPAASADSIIASSTDSMTVDIAQATAYKVTRYDELSVDLTYFKGTDKLVTVVLVAGSPYIQLTAEADTSVTLTVSTATGTAAIKKTLLEANAGLHTYYASSSDDVRMKQQSPAKADFTVPANGLVSFFGTPATQSSEALRKYANNRITGTAVKYIKESNIYRTNISIQTENNKPTVLGYLPHMHSQEHGFMQYATIYGTQNMVSGTTFSSSTPVIGVKPELDISKITPAEKAELVTTLRQEINATKYTAIDTYFSGKEMYRSAQLLQLAEQLQQTDISSTMQSNLRHELTGWLTVSNEKTKKQLYYDADLHSIVGFNPSFGSESGNDHHFHYGYFIYAAAVLARYDPEFARDYHDEVNVLVADIANYSNSSALPLRRSFDPYFGHSWASGTSPFNDGNNQESISESLNAWTGTALWGAQSGNKALQDESSWMLSVEASAGKAYWLEPATDKAPFNNIFTHTLVTLNWGGKRDSATFFSADPNAKLGISLIPMNPTMANIVPDQARRSAQLAEAAPTTFNLQFGDYLLMYKALDNTADELPAARQLPDSFIDNGNSRSYMYAWIISQRL